jgi:hypothetical protein
LGQGGEAIERLASRSCGILKEEIVMEGYRYQQLAYLIVPLIAGTEFFRNARFIRNKTGKESARAVTLDACGYGFIAFIPAIFFFTIFSLESHRFPLFLQLLHRFDRYGVMFLFLGSWWQVFLITALRARRTADTGGSMLRSVWVPYLLLGVFISALILWVAPFNLMWVSVFWFLASFGVIAAVTISPDKVCRLFMVLAVVTFVGENILFIILDAIV